MGSRGGPLLVWMGGYPYLLEDNHLSHIFYSGSLPSPWNRRGVPSKGGLLPGKSCDWLHIQSSTTVPRLSNAQLPMRPPTQPQTKAAGPHTAPSERPPTAPRTAPPWANILNKYPNAAVTAPLPNLPPPATEARPPTRECAMSPSVLPSPVNSGPANDPAAPDNAPGPHLPPEAMAERQPTAA